MSETRYLKHRISVKDHRLCISDCSRPPEPIFTTDYLDSIFQTMCPEHTPLCVPIESDSVSSLLYDRLEAGYKEGVVHQLVLVEGYLMTLSFLLLEKCALESLCQYTNILAKALYDRYTLNKYRNSDLLEYVGSVEYPYECNDPIITTEEYVGSVECPHERKDYTRITEVNLYIPLADTGNGTRGSQ